ncbi:hypothetical protein ACIRJR_14220 [Streptomyces sp. NPDC102402]|uniref:hypothetical protein n=1 Tax=Streptomyces sp. NPDC102402 TaxID=3366169 RepID=UPI003819C8CE
MQTHLRAAASFGEESAALRTRELTGSIAFVEQISLRDLDAVRHGRASSDP